LITGTAANTPVALTVGTNGQLLAACSACTTGLTWVAPPAAATPIVAGIVLGCTDTTNAALGCNALRVNVGVGNVAVGLDSLCTNTTGGANVAVGLNSMRTNTIGTNNVAVGNRALCANTIGNGNVAIGTVALNSAVDASRTIAIGENALCAATTGLYNVALGWGALSSASGAGGSNVALGALAGCNITTGSSNVTIGSGVTVPNGSQSCQLAIGWNTGQCWLTGDSGKNVKFWAGIRDCTDSLGAPGQVLTSNGTVAQWAVPSKGYIYVLVPAGSYNAINTLPLTVMEASQISVFFNNFVLTPGRTYLFNSTLSGNVNTSVTAILRWVNNIGEVGPEVRLNYGQWGSSSASSWIYKPVTGTESIRLDLRTQNISIYSGSSIVITEL
jgi:hypothetical protein